MVAYAEQTLRALGYKPYYLYRQKYMSGSFENVGWSRDNLDCLYNIYMMEEVHTILSLGGGGMNKVNLPDGTLRRFHNPKFPEQYIEMLPGVLEQKQELFRLMTDGRDNAHATRKEVCQFGHPHFQCYSRDHEPPDGGHFWRLYRHRGREDRLH